VDFEWTDEQREYRDVVLHFARSRLSDGVAGRDAGHEFSAEGWRACAEVGIQGLPVPEEYGGSGANATTIVLALEALGYGCEDNGLIFALNAQMWACEVPLVRFGSEEQKRRYLPGLCDGSAIGAQAMSEPEAGSDALSLTTTAERRGDSYIDERTGGRHLPRLCVDRPEPRLRRCLRVPARPRHARPFGRAPAREDGSADFTHERGLPRRV
jgi:alkylation response protein AidB-like acyl-CoA dehydrogenase